jgi:RimJ/RimL family protein N-acetyltransferase
MKEKSMPGNVTLRDVTPADLPIFYQHQHDPAAAHMAGFPSREWEPFLAHWNKILLNDSIVKKTIIVDGEVAGNIVSFVQEGEREVGYWIGREYWGKGVATQALRQFLDLVQERPLFAHVAKHNTASFRVLEKCGFRLSPSEEASQLESSGESEEITLVFGAGEDEYQN